MRIHSSVRSSINHHEAVVCTNGQSHGLEIPPNAEGRGSSVNGGELLLLALATCYCNDVYREAARRAIPIEAVEVTAEAEFAAEGQAASSVSYRARVTANASEAAIVELLQYTDRVAEIQNTVRAPVPVSLASIEAVVAP